MYQYSMKFFFSCVMGLLFAAQLPISATEDQNGKSKECTAESCTTCDQSTSPSLTIINAADLKKILDKDPTITVVDARTAKWDNKERIGNALSIPCDSSEKTIVDMLPSKTQQIVVYCGSIKCPQGKILADKLIAMGYLHVYDMKEGIEGWKAMGYPISKVQ